jgi:hypothetical protein
LVAGGEKPRSPVVGDPQYDLGWTQDGVVFIAEVKSVSATNEERQLRLGLGQVLRYRHLLGVDDVRAVIVVSQQPYDESWKARVRRSGFHWSGRGCSTR